jgi:hypothetical protein
MRQDAVVIPTVAEQRYVVSMFGKVSDWMHNVDAAHGDVVNREEAEPTFGHPRHQESCHQGGVLRRGACVARKGHRNRGDNRKVGSHESVSLRPNAPHMSCQRLGPEPFN